MSVPTDTEGSPPDGAEVVVVGGGLVGACLAYELVGRDVDVLLVDGGDPGRATAAGAGILSPHTTQHPDAAWFAIAGAAGDHYPELMARLAEDGEVETGYQRCGLLSVAVRPGDDEWFERAAALTLARSPEVLHEISPDEARDRFPPLGEVRRAVHNPAAARVDGRILLAAVLAAACRRGLRTADASVTGFDRRGEQVVAVATDAGRIPCGSVALAAGCWSAPLGEALGFPLPVQPTKGQIVHLVLPGASSGAWPIVQPVLSHYLVAWPGGRVACGGTFEPDAGFDVRPTAAGLRQLLRECLVVAPGLGDATFAEVRVGLRPTTADGLPLVGPVPGWANVHVVTGHGAEGLLLGPYCAAVAARAVVDGRWGDDVALFAPARLDSTAPEAAAGPAGPAGRGDPR